MAGRTPLHIALEDESSIEIIESLLAAGADVNLTNEVEETPLHVAVKRGRSLELIKLLLAAGTDVTVTNKYEETALHCAVKNNRDLRVIEALLMAGGDVNFRDGNENTLLHMVCNAALASELIRLGLSINAVNLFGETPLHTAAVREGRGIGLIETLLVADADVNAMNSFGETALYCAVKNNCDLRVINALLMAGGGVNFRDGNENTLLHVVCNAGLASELICRGLSINAVNVHEETPLHTAAREGRGIELIDCLLAAGGDVNAANNLGETALYCAVQNNCGVNVIKALLMAGGDVNCVVNGNTLLHVVGSAEVASELISLGLNVNAENLEFTGMPLYFAIMRGRGIELIESLLAAGANVNATNKDGKNSLYYAVETHRHVRVIKALLMAGGDVNFRINGNTLLHVVGSADVARELLSQGLSVNATNDCGETPLCCVAKDVPGYFGLSEHELYECSEFPHMMSQNERNCYDCRFKELVWTLVLHGAVIRCAVISPLDTLLETDNIPWTEFFIKVDVMKSYFDLHGETFDLSSYRSFFIKLKMRSVLSDSYCIELCQFLDSAITEIIQMKCDMINDNQSLYNFFFKCEKSVKIFPLYPRCDNIEEEISIKYPIYRELILPKIRASVKRSTLLDQLKGLTIYVMTSETEEISIKYDILYEIVEYLSDDDLVNLIKCVIDK